MSQPTSDDLVLIDVDRGVAVVTWNRPERNNGWSVPLEEAYYDALRTCEADPEVRVIVVTGAGRSFCPGMDTQTLSAQASGGPSSAPHARQPMTLPTTIAKPVIAAINGACAGIGLIAAMNCDLRFASETAKLTTAFAKRGIMAEHGVAWPLVRQVGTSTALDLLYSSRVVLGEEALRLGLVDRIFPAEELLEQTLLYARDMAANSSPIALGTIKRQVYSALESTHEEARTLAIRYWYDDLMSHPDFKEGVASFLEKRAPQFQPWDTATTADPAPLPED